jgi:putative ABC transport system permease protein
MTTWLRNVRHGFRILGSNKGFTAVAILAVALGIGPNTAIFSVVWGVMLAPLPFPEADSMVVVWSKINGDRNAVPADDYLEYVHQSRSLTAFAYSTGGSQRMLLPGDPEPVLGGSATGFAQFNGLPNIQFGNDWFAQHATPGNDHYVTLNHRLWVERFHSDPNVIGKQVEIDDEPYTIVAVRKPGNEDKQVTQFVTPLALSYGVHDPRWGNVFARLKPGVTRAQAQAELETITRRIAANHPKGFPPNWGVSVEAFHNDWLDPKLQRNFWLLMASVGFVLLIACANVASLLLAKGVAREKEMALRTSLGASRWQLFSQLLSESLVLAGIGGAVGVALGWSLIKLALTGGHAAD